MTNYEKLRQRYKNWTPSKARIIAAYGIKDTSGDLQLCNCMDCKNCIFNVPRTEACGYNTEDWLDQEAEK